jgi:hypothetical protein
VLGTAAGRLNPEAECLQRSVGRKGVGYEGWEPAGSEQPWMGCFVGGSSPPVAPPAPPGQDQAGGEDKENGGLLTVGQLLNMGVVDEQAPASLPKGPPTMPAKLMEANPRFGFTREAATLSLSLSLSLPL